MGRVANRVERLRRTVAKAKRRVEYVSRRGGLLSLLENVHMVAVIPTKVCQRVANGFQPLACCKSSEPSEPLVSDLAQ
jgi:hypothetical protein